MKAVSLLIATYPGSRLPNFSALTWAAGEKSVSDAAERTGTLLIFVKPVRMVASTSEGYLAFKPFPTEEPKL